MDLWVLGTFYRLVSWPGSLNQEQMELSGAEEPSSSHLPVILMSQVPPDSSKACALGVLSPGTSCFLQHGSV